MVETTKYDYLQMEEFSKDLDHDFMQKSVLPYFQEVFLDLAQRENDYDPAKPLISKITFLEVCPRAFTAVLQLAWAHWRALLRGDGRRRQGLHRDEGIRVHASACLHQRYGQQAETYLQNVTPPLTSRYDFNKDGRISKEDVRLVLSYAPFARGEHPPTKRIREGKYGSDAHKYLLQIIL